MGSGLILVGGHWIGGHSTGVTENCLAWEKAPHIWCQKCLECGSSLRLEEKHTIEVHFSYTLSIGQSIISINLVPQPRTLLWFGCIWKNSDLLTFIISEAQGWSGVILGASSHLCQHANHTPGSFTVPSVYLLDFFPPPLSPPLTSHPLSQSSLFLIFFPQPMLHDCQNGLLKISGHDILCLWCSNNLPFAPNKLT